MEKKIVYMVSETDDHGPCFTDPARAESIRKHMGDKTDGMFYVTLLHLDPTDDDAIKELERSWHSTPEEDIQ